MGLQRIRHNWATFTSLHFSALCDTLNWHLFYWMSFLGGTSGKECAYQCRRLKRPGFDTWIRKILGVENGILLQNSCLENSTGRGVWGLQSMGPQGIEHYWVTDLTHTHKHTHTLLKLNKWCWCSKMFLNNERREKVRETWGEGGLEKNESFNNFLRVLG